jgi:nitrate/TMAO reductase-like tetraheme cytochrome c subunit
MFDRIRKNIPQVAATIAVAAITYACMAVLLSNQPSDRQQTSALPVSPLPLGGEPTDYRNQNAADLSNIRQPKGTKADANQLELPPEGHRFTEEEKIVFASLPPMCVPPMDDVGQMQIAMPTQTPPTALVKSKSVKKKSDATVSLASRNSNAMDIGRSAEVEFVGAPNSKNQNSVVAADFVFDPKEFQAAARQVAATNEFDPKSRSAVQPASFSSMHSAGGPTHNPPSDPTLKVEPGEDPHAAVYSRTAFPSARQCAQCHRQIYEEWSSSSHAYASISPMFHVFEDTINRLSQGTIGYFCYRCHSPVSTTQGLRRDQAIWDGPRVFREGVTCIACHRVKTPYGKVDGERRIEPGDIYDPVYGSGDGHGVAIADKYSQVFKVKTKRSTDKRPGQPMHRRAIQFEELSKSSFCMSCHQVAVEPGIKLEVVWDQYRASPAYRDGVTCQDCHMGIVPGLDEGYSIGPGAVVNHKVINPEKKHSNHVFYGPGYSIAHPGVFPDNLDADRWTVPQWLEFDWRAGWGTDEFEDALADGRIQWSFPQVWQEADDRYDAREIVQVNLKKLEYKRDLRRQLLENGSQLDGPFFLDAPTVGQSLNFRYCITNRNTGHNMPSGSLGAQPQIWLNAVLIGPDGNRIWETGYMDSNGDLADNHSLDVLARKVPLDTQLVNLQTKFLTTNVKGTDREMYLPVNFDFDQLPFLRPPQQPVSVQNHPPFIRMEGHSIPPLGKRNAKFAVPARLMQIPGTYRLSVRMRSRAEPIYFMRFCNATSEMQRMMNEWICDFHMATVSFEVR